MERVEKNFGIHKIDKLVTTHTKSKNYGLHCPPPLLPPGYFYVSFNFFCYEQDGGLQRTKIKTKTKQYTFLFTWEPYNPIKPRSTTVTKSLNPLNLEYLKN